VAFGHVCDVDDIDIVLTDSDADSQAVDDLQQAGVDVRCV
jgi:DeoR/GlpR family transcriptional regulator of sugar metabolism